MRIFFVFLFASVLTHTAFAQRISGTVQQVNHQPVEFATVTLRKAADSSLVKGTLTDAEGLFEINDVPEGRYLIEAHVLGMKKSATPAFDYQGNDYTLSEPVMLMEQARELAAVTIVSRKPPIEVKADKTILNVEGSFSSTGLNALELLRKAPGVTVDNNENVNVKGKNKVRILIDGRETPLSGKDLAATLKSLQASDILAIEIISNPSAKYDAAGNAGIINIRLKKNKALGTNGNLGAGFIYGHTPKGDASLSLNHRTKKVNIFGTVNGNAGDWRSNNNIYRVQNETIFDQQSTQTNEGRFASARVGLDWFANDKHTFGALVRGKLDGGAWASTSRTLIGAENTGAYSSILDAENVINNDNTDFNINFNYRYADTTGHSVNVDIDRGVYAFRGLSNQPNIYKTPDETQVTQRNIYRLVMPTDIVLTTAKADYEQRLWKGTFGAGFKISDVNTDNTFDFYNVRENQTELDNDKSNRFKYAERTFATYINYNRQFGKKLNLQSGLRVESTRYTGDLISNNHQNGEKVEADYTELFPSAALTYTLNKKMGLNLTYSHRIDRPGYQDLNPFEFKLNELTYQKGNPRLRPQFTHNIELSPTFGGFPILTIGHSRTKDVFAEIIDTANVQATYVTQANIADQRNYTLTINAPTPITKWWEGFVSITGMRSHVSASFRENFRFEQSFYALNAYAEQTIKLPKGFGVQVSGWCNSPVFWGAFKSQWQGMMDIGIQKKILDGKGDLRLRIGDVLRTGGYGAQNRFSPGLRMDINGVWESRTVSLNFNYRFGRSEVKQARQRKTGLEDESNRVKSGRG
jgi:hypothetical protein